MKHVVGRGFGEREHEGLRADEQAVRQPSRTDLNGSADAQDKPADLPIIEMLPAAIYTTDAEGRITYFNEAAAEMWGCRPEIGKSEFCGSWKLYWPDGTPLPHDECPMATALKEKRPIRGMEAIAERPDGTRIPFIPYPTPLFDASGTLTGAVNMLVDISERKRAEIRLAASEQRYRGIFESARVAVWEEDFSAVADLLDEIRAEGVRDLRAYFRSRPAQLAEAVRRVRLLDVNDFTVELFEAPDKKALLGSLADIFLPETEAIFVEELVALWEGRRRFESETVVRSLTGRRIDVTFTMVFGGERFERTLVSIFDVSAKKAAERRVEALNHVARMISRDLDLDRIVQTVTDSATELSGARFGAFFYNVTDQEGERFLLYALSGAPRAAFDRFGVPRNTAIFEPTFRGTGIVRSDDIRIDPRYGKSAPHHGMPKGHLPVVSYLAVPVVSRSGEVHGGLFFGHDQAGMFTEAAEEIVSGIAAHAAVAIDNARLLQAANEEVARRRRTENDLADLFDNRAVAMHSVGPDGIILRANQRELEMLGYARDEYVGRHIAEFHVDQGLIADVLKRLSDGEVISNIEAQLRCKDGAIRDVVIGANVLWEDGKFIHTRCNTVDVTERKRAEHAIQRMAAMIDSADDAIISKDLAGIVTSWNKGAERLFGYTAEEMVGKSIITLIPEDRHHEEQDILARVRRGEPIHHYETVRRRKDGSPLDISLTVSPIKDRHGRIVGASKIARDISERRQAQARQDLLSREVQHRTKNMFAVVQAVVGRSFAGKETVKDAEVAVLSRLHSLAETHAMLVDKEWQGAEMAEIVHTELAPYTGRVTMEGPSISLEPRTAQNFALAVHELATNAAKYGALSNATGVVRVTWSVDKTNGSRLLSFRWREHGGPLVAPPMRKGFGSVVLEKIMEEHCGAPPMIDFAASELTYEVSYALDAMAEADRPVS